MMNSLRAENKKGGKNEPPVTPEPDPPLSSPKRALAGREKLLITIEGERITVRLEN